MRRALVPIAFSTMLVGLFLTAAVASAKGPVDLITIARPDGGGPVEITDPVALAEFSPWGNEFFDAKLEDEPEVGTGYAVNFLLEQTRCQTGERGCQLVTELEPIYGFDYYPTATGGYVYLPEDGPGKALNDGTIVREGGWFEASEEWNTLASTNLPASAGGIQAAQRALIIAAFAAIAALAGVSLAAARRAATARERRG